MKKILLSILVVLLSFYIFACGNKSSVAITSSENEIPELIQMYLDIKDGKKKTYYYTDGSVFQSFGEIAKIDDVDSDREEVLKVFNEYKNMKDDYTSIANIIKRIMKFA